MPPLKPGMSTHPEESSPRSLPPPAGWMQGTQQRPLSPGAPHVPQGLNKKTTNTINCRVILFDVIRSNNHQHSWAMENFENGILSFKTKNYFKSACVYFADRGLARLPRVECGGYSQE